MKAISLHQPWATLVAVGAKHIETRSWSTPYRGPLAIHAAKRWTPELKVLLNQKPFGQLLRAHGYVFSEPWLPLPFGVVIAECELHLVVKTTDVELTETERALGDYRPGRWAWMLRNIALINPPVPCRGCQGLWDWKEKP